MLGGNKFVLVTLIIIHIYQLASSELNTCTQQINNNKFPNWSQI